jgi:hypothetical protein
MVLNIRMRYKDILEADANAQANARLTQRQKLAVANDKATTAAKTYQNTVKAAHTICARVSSTSFIDRSPFALRKAVNCGLKRRLIADDEKFGVHAHREAWRGTAVAVAFEVARADRLICFQGVLGAST